MKSLKYSKEFQLGLRKYKHLLGDIAPVIGLLSLAHQRVKRKRLIGYKNFYSTNVRGGIIILWEERKSDIILHSILQK